MKQRSSLSHARNHALFCVIALLLTIWFEQICAQTPANTPSTQASVQAVPDNDGIRYGFTGLFNYNLHNSLFLQLPYAVKENLTDYVFRNGTGTGFSAGVMAEFPIFRWLNLGVRASYVQRGGTMLSRLDSTIVGRRDGTGDVGVFRRMFSTDYATGGADFFFNVNPAGGLNIYLGGRIEFAVSKSWQQSENLLAPSDGVFPDSGERTRNVQSGTIPNVRNLGVANLNMEVFEGIGYEIPIHPSGAWTLEPSVFYSSQIFNILLYMERGEYWNIQSLRGGLTLRYYPVREARFDEQLYKVKQLASMEKQLAEERKRIQTELRELSQAGVMVKVELPDGLNTDGSTVQNPTVRVEQFRSLSTVQLLPHIFFNENSSVIPARYRRISSSERTSYNINRYNKLPPVELYRHILNIVGKRLQDRPDARLMLVGFIAPGENANKKLALQRAETVSDYLQDVWKIASNRLSVTAQETALGAASVSNEADMRRVDMSSSDATILQAISLESLYETVSPPALRFSLDIRTGAGLKQWNMEVSQFDGNEIKTLFNAEGKNTFSKEYIWLIGERALSIPTASGSLDTKLEVTDVNNRNSDAPIQTTPVEVRLLADKIVKKVPDTRVDVWVIVAPLGKTITDSETLQTLKSSLSAQTNTVQASITAEGWADGTDEQPDTQTADARTQQALQALSGVKSTFVSSKKTVSWRKPLHNDAGTQEGRLYNRAVKIEVRTPVQY